MTGQELIDHAPLSKVGHGYVRVRDSKWANPDAYLRLSVFLRAENGRVLGPWGHLFDRRTQEAIGEKTPQQLLTFAPPFSKVEFLAGNISPYTGPLDPADLG